MLDARDEKPEAGDATAADDASHAAAAEVDDLKPEPPPEIDERDR
jgi:hypothetical protein